MSVRVYLSLGSNIEPQRHLGAALREMCAEFGEIEVSPAYRFAAIGFDGPDFVNLVTGLDTDRDVLTLNEWLHALEDRHGRRRDVPRYSSRTLDVDIVLYGAAVMTGAGHLQVPRDELRHAFVLKPLAELAPQVRHPLTGETMDDLWKKHAQYLEVFPVVTSIWPIE